jgi:SAM-dependent methyltransferase
MASLSDRAEIYDQKFFSLLGEYARISAPPIVNFLRRHLEIHSLLDVGCGQGGWLAVWKSAGVNKIYGVDGPHVDTRELFIPGDVFHAHDLREPFDLGRKFSLVQCLEVAEHLEHRYATQLVASLVRHGLVIYFSAAPPGQGGYDHINEQPYEYWRDLFLQHNYHLFDPIRPAIREERQISSWYRFNSLLFVHASMIENLPAEIRGTSIPDAASVPSYAPWWYRLRCAFVRHLPPHLQIHLARLKTWLRVF